MPRGMKNSTSNLNYTGILRNPKKKQLNFNFEVKCLNLIESLKIMVLKDKDTNYVLLETGVLIAYNQNEVYKYD